MYQSGDPEGVFLSMLVIWRAAAYVRSPTYNSYVIFMQKSHSWFLCDFLMAYPQIVILYVDLFFNICEFI